MQKNFLMIYLKKKKNAMGEKNHIIHIPLQAVNNNKKEKKQMSLNIFICVLFCIGNEQK